MNADVIRLMISKNPSSASTVWGNTLLSEWGPIPMISKPMTDPNEKTVLVMALGNICCSNACLIFCVLLGANNKARLFPFLEFYPFVPEFSVVQ